jgi:hypothetical protein
VKHLSVIVLMAATSLGMPILLPADDVYLKDGEVLEGVIVSKPGASTIDLRIGTQSMTVLRHFNPENVLRVTYGISAHQKALNALYARKEAMVESATAEDWWHMSVAARGLDDNILAKECANQTIQRDRAHVEAHRFLGLVLFKGVWMRPNEVAVCQGLVAYEGHWMSWTDRETLIAHEEKRRADLAAQRAAAIALAQAQADANAPIDLPPPTDLGGTTGISTGVSTGLVPYGGFYRVNWGPTATPVARPRPLLPGTGLGTRPGTTGFGNLPASGVDNPRGWNF